MDFLNSKLIKQTVASAYVVIALFFLYSCDRMEPYVDSRVDQLLPGGLQASYYKGIDFNKRICKRTERKIDRVYTDYPAGCIPKGSFSVKFEGYLSAPADDIYSFKMQSNGGSRIFLGGKMILDNWDGRDFIPKSEDIKIKKGRHPIIIEYFYNSIGEARIRLKWNGEKSMIPPGSILSVPYISKK